MSNDYEDEVDETLQCNACVYEIDTAQKRNLHYKTEWHRYNVKRRCAGLGPLSERVFLQKVNEIKAQSAGTQAVRCELCNLNCKNQRAYEAHIRTKKHLGKELNKARQVCVSFDLLLENHSSFSFSFLLDILFCYFLI